MKPISIQTPKNRAIGQWTAEVQIAGKAYVLPVLHAHNFDKAGRYADEMKLEDGSGARGVRYEEHMAALANAENKGLVIIQRTTTDENGTRRHAGYVGVYETRNLKFSKNGYSLNRGRQVAMFTK